MEENKNDISSSKKPKKLTKKEIANKLLEEKIKKEDIQKFINNIKV
jgi:hypothetical protein